MRLISFQLAWAEEAGSVPEVQSLKELCLLKVTFLLSGHTEGAEEAFPPPRSPDQQKIP